MSSVPSPSILNSPKVYKADLRAVFVINNLDGVVDDEPLARARAVHEATPRPRVEAVLDSSGAEISPAIAAYVPSATQLLAVSQHEAAVRSAYSLIVLTTGPRVKQMIAVFDGDGPAAYHHLLRHYESDDMYAVLDLFWATLSSPPSCPQAQTGPLIFMQVVVS